MKSVIREEDEKPHASRLFPLSSQITQASVTAKTQVMNSELNEFVFVFTRTPPVVFCAKHNSSVQEGVYVILEY